MSYNCKTPNSARWKIGWLKAKIKICKFCFLNISEMVSMTFFLLSFNVNTQQLYAIYLLNCTIIKNVYTYHFIPFSNQYGSAFVFTFDFPSPLLFVPDFELASTCASSSSWNIISKHLLYDNIFQDSYFKLCPHWC